MIQLLWGSPNAEETLLPQEFKTTRGVAVDLAFARQSTSTRVITGASIKVRFATSKNVRMSLEIDALVSGTVFTASLTEEQSASLIARKWYFQAFDETGVELLSHGWMNLLENIALLDQGGTPLVSTRGPTGVGTTGPTGPPGPVGPGGGDASTAFGLGQFSLTTSAEFFGVISDETGSGTGAKVVGSLSPRFLTDIAPASNGGATLGTTSLGWGTLHVATNWTLNAANGNAIITHSTGAFTVTTGDFRIQVAGTNPLSAATLEGTQTFKNKTYFSPIFAGVVAIPSGAFAPLLVGGDLAASPITIQTTTSGSPASGADIIFKSSTTEFGRFLNSGVLQVPVSITTATAAPGTSTTDVATTAFVQAAVSASQAGLDTKLSCRAATTANITLSGPQTIDGISVVAGNRVLVKDQSTASANGIYVCASGAWSRSTDADTSAEVTSGLYTFIEEGTANAGSGWVLTTADPITLGTTALTFTRFTGGSSYTAGTGINITGQVLSVDQGFSPSWSGNHTFSNIITGSVTGNAATATTLATSRNFWGQAFTGAGDVTGSLTSVGNITGGASSMTIQAGTGNSRTLTLKTTNSSGVAVTALTLDQNQAATFANDVTATNFVGALTGNATTASTLATTRTIGGSNFNGGSNVTSFPAPGAIGGTTPSTGVFTTLQATGNMTVDGDLIVNGATITAAVDTFTVEDPLVKFANNNAADTVDIGFYGLYVSSGSKYTGLFRDATDGKYKLFTGLTVEPTTTVNTAGSGYAVGTLVANIEGNLTASTVVINSGGITTEDLTVNDSFLVNNTTQGIKFDGDTTLARTATGKMKIGGGAIPLSSNTSDLTFTGHTAARTHTLPDENAYLGGPKNLINGRLTTETGVAISTSDRTAQGTIYWTAYGGNQISLYDGSMWKTYAFTSDISLALTLTSGKNYDVFIYNNSGTLTIELSAAWTNDTARADALTTQDGVYVKSGSTTRRYVGTIRASGTNTTEDSVAKRFVWNAYNRVSRQVFKTDATSSWTYTTDTWRQVRATATNQIEAVIGLSGYSLVNLTALNIARNSSVGPALYCGIGEDSTSAVPTNALIGTIDNPVVGGNNDVTANYRNRPTLGYHFYPWLERSQATGTSTWFGASSGNSCAGIHGTVEC